MSRFAKPVRSSRWFVLQASLAALLLAALAGKALANDPPSIMDFECEIGIGPQNVWHFTGKVDDEFPGGCTVSLYGMDGLIDTSVPVGPEGDFLYSQVLPEGESGWVYAVATDQMGLESQEVKTFVDG